MSYISRCYGWLANKPVISWLPGHTTNSNATTFDHFIMASTKCIITAQQIRHTNFITCEASTHMKQRTVAHTIMVSTR